MKAQSIYQYIWMGTSLRFLQDVREGFGVHGESKIFVNINHLLDSVEKFDLHVTKKAAKELGEFRDELSKKPSDYALTLLDADKLNKIVTSLRETLMAESEEKYIYVVSPKRISVEMLLNNAPFLMRPGAYANMSSIAQYDFRESCLCIAFERPTAAAYHLLRTTEEVLRQYYMFSVKKKRISQLMWGNIIHSLQEKNKIPKELLSNLDYIRKTYRNPTDHPEMVYDIQEIQDLFGLCIEAIHKMLIQMKLI